MNDLEDMMIAVVMRKPIETVKMAMDKDASKNLRHLQAQAKHIQKQLDLVKQNPKAYDITQTNFLKNKLNTIMGKMDTLSQGVEKDIFGNYKLTQDRIDMMKKSKNQPKSPLNEGAGFFDKVRGYKNVKVRKGGKLVTEEQPVDSYFGRLFGNTPNADQAMQHAMADQEQRMGNARQMVDAYRKNNNIKRDVRDVGRGSVTDFMSNLRPWDRSKGFLTNMYNVGDSIINNPAVKTWSDRFNRLNNTWMYANALTGNMPQQLIQQGMYSLIPHQQTFWESLHPGMQSMIIGGAGLGAGMAGYGLYRNLSRKKEQQPQYAPVMMMPVKQSSLKPEMQKEAGIGNPFRAAADVLTSGYNKVNDFFNNPELLKWENGIGNWLDLTGNGLQFANTTLGGVDTLADIIRLRMQTPKTTALAGLSDGAKALISAGIGGGLAYGGYKAMKDLEAPSPEETAVNALAQRGAGL